jgi:glycosyltransferase involved in cell wall biosynthesis
LTLRRAGLDVTVVCPRGEQQDQESFAVWEGIEIHRYPLAAATGGPLGYVREYGRALRETSRLVRKLTSNGRFDVVHACNPPDLLLLPALHLKHSGTRFLFDHHDLVPELYLSRFGRGRDLLYFVVVALERLAFRLADVVIATNESYREVAIRRGRKRPDDVFVVRSAPSSSRFRPVEPDLSLKRGRRYLIAYLGVMGPQDGVDHALRALAQLRNERDDWQAVFIGAGDVYPAMRALATELGLDAHVEFTGRIPDDDVVRILSTADVCLAPDPKTPLNDVSTMNKILEYMALAKPLVAYDLREARVSAGDGALYATPDDVGSFARCIGELLSDDERRRTMGEAGREKFERALSWEHSENALLAAYERALGRPLPRPVQT